MQTREATATRGAAALVRASVFPVAVGLVVGVRALAEIQAIILRPSLSTSP